MSGFREKVIVIGADGLGAIVPLAETLRRYGFRQVLALVDDSSRYDTGDRPWLRIMNTPITTLTAPALLRDRLVAEGLDALSPVLCIYDGLTIPYLKAISPPPNASSWRVPSAGIMRARSKPHARLALQNQASHRVAWRVLSTSQERQAAWDGAALFPPSESAPCFVKPCTGAQSAHVARADNYKHALAIADEIRRKIQTTALWAAQPMLIIDDLEVSPTEDILVEQQLDGPEYTIDGVIAQGAVHCVVQHKELTYNSPFHGDGLVMSPPDPNGHVRGNLLVDRVRDGSVISTPHTRRPIHEFEDFIRSALDSIKLDDWVFHAEAVDTDRGLRLVELNPRIPGGLLSRTAQFHLGVDLLDALVRCALSMPVPIPRTGVTAHVPFYADDVGEVAEVIGVDQIQGQAGVEFAASTIKPGTFITDRHRENYAGFVVFAAPSHSMVRDEIAKQMPQVRVRYADEDHKRNTPDRSH